MLFLRKPSPAPDDITILIKTFQRPKTVNKSIKKIRAFYADIPIIVADDSREPISIDDENTQVFRLSFDSGLSRGRNFLLNKLDTKYFLLMDDDNAFSRGTNLQVLKEILEAYNLDILSCLIYERSLRKKELYRKKLKNYCMNFTLRGNTLRFTKDPYFKDRNIILCDIVENFFLAKADSVRCINGWDDRLKIGEHEDFFIRAKMAGLKVAYTRRVSVDHVIFRDERFSKEYQSFRCRMPEFKKIWLEKHNIDQIVDANNRSYSKQEYIKKSKW